MKKSVILTFLAFAVLSGCGKETVIKEVLVTSPPEVLQETPQANKYDAYIEYVVNSSAQARSWSESDLLELGTLVCQSFEEGLSFSDIIQIFSNNSSGLYDDELYASVFAAAVTFLCPEYKSYVDAQL